jgi:CRP-like cAMP-binding protein
MDDIILVAGDLCNDVYLVLEGEGLILNFEK